MTSFSDLNAAADQLLHNNPYAAAAGAQAQDNALAHSNGLPASDAFHAVMGAVNGVLGPINPVAAAVAATGMTGGGSAFDPTRWLVGGVGIALIIGGIIIAAK